MGIQGLLPLLKSIQKPTHLRNFAGQTLGIDAYGWLHRGTVACAIELAQEKPTRKHIDFALHRVQMLIHFGVKPYLVFDGDNLPSKSHTENERAERRKESRRLGLDLLRMGKVAQAQLELQKAVDVTPLMARELIEDLKSLGVPYIVAPFEADSQLAYLEKQNVISGILSEDSDLLVFGARCLLTKLDQHGECIMINRADFTACREISLVGWTDNEFRSMAMLSGCDYLPGIGKMGLKTAYRLVRKYKVIDRIIRTLQFDGKMKVPPGYLDAFTNAERTFLYQWVFCPKAQCLLNLNAIPNNLQIDSMPYLGKSVEPKVAAGVAVGDLDPNTKRRLVLANRPQHSAARTRAMQTPNEKLGKPIADFFKAKRTPLAELDPNSFVPSPSQRQLLEGQPTASWSASQVSGTRVPALDRVTPRSAPSSAPQAARPISITQAPSIQRVSPKRQRLCSEITSKSAVTGSMDPQSATSRYFLKQTSEASPSIRKASGLKKDTKFELWCDASAARNVASSATKSIPVANENASSPRKRKKLAVFDDNSFAQAERATSADLTSADTSQETTATFTAGSLADVRQIETPDTSFENTTTRSELSTFSESIDMNFTEFAFQPSTPRKKSVRRTESTPHTFHTSSRKTERRDALRCLINPTQGSRLPDSIVEPTSGGYDTIPNSSPLRSNIGAGREDDVDDEKLPAIEQQTAREAPRMVVRGSEDLLVPESPNSESDDGRFRPKLDLGRYAFTG